MKLFRAVLISLSVAASVSASEPRVVDRGAHHRTWETTREVPTPDGKTRTETGSYVELQGGLHRWTDQGWVETNPRIEVFQDGAVARNLQYQAIFAPNLATPGAIDLLLPDGQRLQGHLLGLAYTEGNQSVLIAEVKDCAGVIGGAEQNEVKFSDAFTDFNISVQFVLQRDRISQNVIVHQQLPHPSEWGLTEDAVLEVLTEFTTVPAVRVENREAVDGVSAQHVSFESMEFVAGRAFSIGNEANATAVSKNWEIFEGQRSFVVEKIPWKAIAPELAKLPPVATDWKKKEGPLMARKQLRLPRREQARAAVKPIQVAQATAPKPGYADMVGRTYKEVNSAASAPYPFTESLYDNKGRLVKQIAFGSVTNLFIYNSLGEIEYSGIDMNADGQLTTASSDRLTRTVRDYSTNGGVHFQRLSTIAYTTIGTSDLITNSVSETSLDGLRSWRSGPGFTNRSQTVINSSAMTRTIYSTNADGAYTITTNLNGRPTGVGQLAANGTLIGSAAYAYDSHGRQFKVVDGRAGTDTVSLFNNADQVVTNIVSASGLTSQTTVNFYNNMGQVWRVMHPDETSVTNEYYVSGLLKKTYGSRTYPVEYKYDAQGRMTNMTTWQSYPSGGAANTAWFYDGYRGWLTNKLDAAGKGAVYTYTPAGWLQTRAWARGTNTTYSYNAAGELTGIDYSDATADVTFTYDRRGRQTGITQGGATTSQVFNDAGQLLSQTANGLTVSNSYDLYFRRTNSGVLNGSAWLTRSEYTYDNASRLQKVGDGTNSATYAYLANSSLIDTITFKENAATRLTTTKTWDNLNRLKKIDSVAGGSTVSSHAYGYNSANQRSSVTNADNARWVYEYDKLGQVTSGKKYWGDGTVVAGQQFEYDFDDIGNRKYAASGGNEWGSNLRYANYTVNNLNQYSQRTVPPYLDVLGSANSNATITVNDTPTYRKGEYFRAQVEAANGAGALWLSLTNLAVLQNGSNPDIVTNTVGNLFVPKTPETFTYDLDGNQTSDGRWTNRWDAENRLIAVEGLNTTPDGAKRKLVFGYDWQGRRTSKIVSNYVSGSWVLASYVRFVYDQWNLLAELNATNNAVISSYMWGLDLSGSEHGAGGVGGLLAFHSTGNGTHFYSFDGNGNVTRLTSSTNGAVTAEYEYDPFLNPLRATGPMVSFNSFTGSGKYWDQETASYYYGFRYLRDGRWLSRDPIQESGGIGLYTLSFNDGIDWIDSDGRAVFRPPIPISPPQTVPIPVVPPGLTPPTGNAGSGSLNSPSITWTDPVAAPELEAIHTKSREKASDACFKLANKKPGKNQYFYASASHERAMGAAAVLWKKQPEPRSRWAPPGFRAALHNPRLTVDRGHLIPAVYGGKADEENVVTQESRYNQGHFRKILEYKLDELLPERSKCNWVCIAVIPKYQPRWKPVPIGFHITIVHRFESSNYEQFYDQQPAMDGNLDFDMPPWRDMNLGWSPLNYEYLQ